MSFDGFTSGVNEQLDWLVPYVTAPEGMAIFRQLRERCDTILLGRVNYEGFLGYWPQVKDDPKASRDDVDISRWLDDVPKVVFSRTLREVTWKNARLAKGSAAEEVAALKRAPGKDILIQNSTRLTRSLLEAGLVDELNITVAPVVVGEGRALFAGLKQRIDLRQAELDPVRQRHHLRSLRGEAAQVARWSLAPLETHGAWLQRSMAISTDRAAVSGGAVVARRVVLPPPRRRHPCEPPFSPSSTRTGQLTDAPRSAPRAGAGGDPHPRERDVRDRSARAPRAPGREAAHRARARAGRRDRRARRRGAGPAGRRSGRRVLESEGVRALRRLPGGAAGALPERAELDAPRWRQFGADARLGVGLRADPRRALVRGGGAALLRRVHGDERPAQRRSQAGRARRGARAGGPRAHWPCS